MKATNERTVARILEQTATLLELKGENPFKVRAYTEAARIVESLEGGLAPLVDHGKLEGIKGIGRQLARDIAEIMQTGELELHGELEAAFPQGVREMLAVPGLGPKKIRVIYEQLGIDSLEALAEAADQGKLASLPGFGAKTQEKLLRAIALYQQSKGRRLYSEAAPVAKELLAALRAYPRVVRAELAGSLRRCKETVKDLDLVASSADPEAVMAHFATLPQVAEIVAKGPTKTTIRLENGLNADLRVVTDLQFPYALHHFTGSMEHNTQLRAWAKARGCKLNEYGLFRVDDGEQLLPCEDETELFAALGLSYIIPELREGRGEIERAAQGPLPPFIERDDLRGTFHAHTTESDGTASLEAMAEAAHRLGLEYLGISDHSEAAHYAHGLSRARIRDQHRRIEALNRELDGFTIFKGIEADILADGRMDYDDETLASFDFVIASIHSRFGMERDQEAMTARVIKAIANPHVTFLGHMTGRLLLSREPYALDLEAVFRALAEHGVILELNCHPDRLDVDWRFIQRALDLGVTLSINPDAHSTAGLADIGLGVAIARKGGVTPDRVFNTLAVSEVREHFAARKRRALAAAR